MLEARLGLPDITAAPQSATPDGLFMCSLEARARSILAPELFGFLPLASCAQRLVILLCL
jgi:hypothetical protein